VHLQKINCIEEGRTEINIAWGSCYGLLGRKNDIFRAITGGSNATNYIHWQPNPPDIFIWGGDAVYADVYKSTSY